jgi:ferredoxin-NADP reductase
MIYGLLFAWAGWRLGQEAFRHGRQRYDRAQQTNQRISNFREALEEIRRALAAVEPVVPKWAGWRQFSIKWKVRESRDCFSLYLVPADGSFLPDFLPGQHVALRLPAQGSGAPVIRCYSLSDLPGRNYYRLTIKDLGREARASHWLGTQAHEGDTVDVKAPGGSFYVDVRKSTPVALIGAGIGVTPLWSMAKFLAHYQPDRRVFWYYTTRSGDHHPLRHEQRRMMESHQHLVAWTCYTQPSARDLLGRDFSARERLTMDALRPAALTPDVDYYVCGPGEFMAAVMAMLRKLGVEPQRIHAEAFGPSSLARISTPERQLASSVHRVTFARSDRDTHCDTALAGLLQSAERLQIPIPSGCRAGNCGACLVRVLAGQVEYARPPDAPIPHGWCLACVARPTSDLVIDA